MNCSTLSPPSRSVVLRDEQLSGAVAEALRFTGYHALRPLQISVEDGCLSLHGCVGSYFLKQIAQSAAKSVPGVRRVINRIEVR